MGSSSELSSWKDDFGVVGGLSAAGALFISGIEDFRSGDAMGGALKGCAAIILASVGLRGAHRAQESAGGEGYQEGMAVAYKVAGTAHEREEVLFRSSHPTLTITHLPGLGSSHIKEPSGNPSLLVDTLGSSNLQSTHFDLEGYYEHPFGSQF
jgi:hypothetical protein